jgi:quercetin dioxygenase-like cupin family protein
MATQGQRIINASTGEQIVFLQTAQDTNGELLQLELWMDAGQTGVPAHLHRLQEERFTVLDGELHVTVAGAARVLRTGESVTIPAGTPHSFGTAHSGAVRLLVELRPALDTEIFFETLAQASQRNRMNLLQIAVLVRELNLGFGVAGVPQVIQNVLFATLASIGRALGYRARYGAER